MDEAARESFGLLTVRRVGECKKDCGQENFPGCSPFSILTYMEQCAIKILYVEKTRGHFGNRLCT